MSEGLDFTNDEGLNFTAWENLDAKQIAQELTGLTSRIRKVTTLLDKMVYNNDYDNTEKEYRNLYLTDFGASGFVPLFINNNKDAFGKYTEESSCPPWYSGLSVDKKKLYDESHRYYIDLAKLIKPIELLGRLMMGMQLKDSFQFMRTTLNFDEAGYDRDVFLDIREDCRNISTLLNRNWVSLENDAIAARNYVDQHRDDNWTNNVIKEYGQARLRDYRAEMGTYKITKHFTCNDNCKVTVNPAWATDMSVIDRYTIKISCLPNIEDNMKKTQEQIAKVSEALSPLYYNIKSSEAITLMDALYKLKDTIYDYTVGGLNVWTCYKNRDDDAPYCFVKPMPTFQGAFGFEPITEDPWHSGTFYASLYRKAAEALSYQCEDFVKNRGVLKL